MGHDGAWGGRRGAARRGASALRLAHADRVSHRRGRVGLARTWRPPKEVHMAARVRVDSALASLAVSLTVLGAAGCATADIPQAHSGQVFEKTGLFAFYSGGRGFTGDVLAPGTHRTGLYKDIHLIDCSMVARERAAGRRDQGRRPVRPGDQRALQRRLLAGDRQAHAGHADPGPRRHHHRQEALRDLRAPDHQRGGAAGGLALPARPS